MIHRRYTVLVDSREKKPLPLPTWLPIKRENSNTATTVEITRRPVCLPAGDYTLEGYEGLCIVERKMTVREVAKNVLDTRDRARFDRALGNLRKAAVYPYLIFEGSLADFEKDPNVEQPWRALDGLIRLIHKYSIPLMFLPATTPLQRIRLGSFIVRLLIDVAISSTGEQGEQGEQGE